MKESRIKEKTKKQEEKIDTCNPIEKIEGVVRRHIDKIDDTILKIEKDKKNAENIKLQNMLDDALDEIKNEKNTFNNLLQFQIKELKEEYSCKNEYKTKWWKKPFYKYTI